MKIPKLLLCVACVIVGYTSCSSDESYETSSNKKNESAIISRATDGEEDSDTFTVHAIYKGVDYRSVAVLDSDKIYYQDQSFIDLMDKIEETEGSVSFVHNDSVVEYFDSQDEFCEKYGIRELTEEEKTRCANAERLNATELYPVTRGIVSKHQAAIGQMNPEDLAYCGVYDDTYYSDTHIFMHLTDSMQVYSINKLKDYKLNDKISSLVVLYNMKDPELCAILTVWEDTNYNYGDHDRTKHRTNFIATKSTPINAVGNLKKISCFNAHDSWNDRISSLSFHLGYADSLPKEY